MTTFLSNLVGTYGYWLIFALVGVESIGIPVPGESTLLAAAVYAGSTHRLSITLVIVLAIAGAIVGDNIGFLIGQAGGYRFLRRYGGIIRLDEHRLKLGQYLVARYGTRMVFFGRFIAVLRIFAAFLAGTNGMPWRRFALANAAACIVWASVMGMLGFQLGASFTGPFGIVALLIAALIAAFGILLLRRNTARWQEEAEHALPGSLDAYHRPQLSRERAA
jgi:membrane protein DedA with SNARE-associated domain